MILVGGGGLSEFQFFAIPFGMKMTLIIQQNFTWLVNCGTSRLISFILFSVALSFTAQGQTSAFYVSPAGSDANSGTAAAPFQTPAAAQAAVRKVSGSATNDITVYLAGGLYRLSTPLLFTSADSGQNGYRIIWKAMPGQTPVLDGGILVTNWTLHDATKNIWQATVSAGAAFRQLYVNGVKANFTRSADALGLVQATNGYSSSNTFLLSLSNSPSVASLEVVTWPQLWQREILPVAAITPSGNVTLQQPCWNMVKNDSYPSYHSPIYVQNAYELLANPGDWYLQAVSNTVYYIPRPGDNMATAVVEAPVLQQLISLQGTVFGPVSNLRFEGISFQMTTWNLVAPGYGFPESQANQPEYTLGNWVIKAAVDGSWLRNVDVSLCQFSQLGGDGVNVLYGSKNVAVDHCLFHDLSASAVQLALGWSPDATVTATDPKIVEGIVLANNTIHDVCTDYPSGCGIYVGYTRNCTIIHNLIYNVPYTGISLGWGWGNANSSFTSGNWIDGNHIHDHMQMLGDGGGVYLNGTQQHATMSHNYAYHQGNVYGVLYLDGGCSQWSIFENVVQKDNAEEWYLYRGLNNHCYSNYTDNGYVRFDSATNCTCSDNTVVANHNWPAAAAAITNAAGPMPTVYYSSAPGSFLISDTNGNGSFAQGLTGWTVGGPANSQAGIIYGYYADSGSPASTNTVAFNTGGRPSGGSLSTTFSGVAGHAYALAYSQANWGQSNQQSLTVTLVGNGNTNNLGTSTTWAPGLYARFGWTFVVTNSGSFTLSFTDVTDPASTTNSDGALTRIELRDATPPTQPLSIVSQPVSLKVGAGAAATFSVQAGGGSGSYTYQWYQTPGNNLTGQTNATLVFTSVTTNLNGTAYYVMVSDGTTSVTSSNALLTVATGVNLVDVNFANNQEAGYPPPISGAAALGSPGDQWNTFTGADGASIAGTNSLANTTGTASGLSLSISVGSFNGVNYASNNIETLFKGSIFLDASHTYGPPGPSTITLSGFVPGQPVNLLLYGDSGCAFTFNNQTLTPAGGSQDSFNAGTYVEYDGLVADGSGKITGVWNTAIGSTYAFCYGLQIQTNAAVPQLTVAAQPTNVTVFVGKSATFTVQASGGTGNYTYQWFQNGGRLAGQTNASLTLSNVLINLNGNNYSATLNDGATTVASSNATLTVRGAALINVFFENNNMTGYPLAISGAAALGSSGDQWNTITGALGTSVAGNDPLNDSTGAAAGVSMSISAGTFDGANRATNNIPTLFKGDIFLDASSVYGGPGPAAISLSGFPPGQIMDLYLYADPASAFRFPPTNSIALMPSGTDYTSINAGTYVKYAGLVADANGQISGKWSNSGSFSYWYGMQIYEYFLPSLTVDLEAGSFVMRWPVVATGFNLYSAPALGPTAVWTPVLSPPAVVDAGNTNYLKIVLPVTGNMFYRLQK